MNKHLANTVGNWRWWVAIPVVVPAGIVSAILWGNAFVWHLAHKAAWETAKGVDKGMGTFAEPLMRWARGRK